MSITAATAMTTSSSTRVNERRLEEEQGLAPGLSDSEINAIGAMQKLGQLQAEEFPGRVRQQGGCASEIACGIELIRGKPRPVVAGRPQVSRGCEHKPAKRQAATAAQHDFAGVH